MEVPPQSVQSTSSSPVPVNAPEPSQLSQTPAASPVKSEIPEPESNESLPSAASCLPDPSPPVPYTITIPSCSGWFSWDEIHETERRILAEFFDGKSPSKNPNVYKYYRDSIIGRFRANPSRKITLTEARRGLVGDVGSIRRVFDFLEAWGLINYTPSARPLPKEKKEAGDTTERKDSSKKLCSNCKVLLCNKASFVTDKADIILCARCFVRGNYRAGLNSADFKRVDVGEETKAEWTDNETLHLLEATLHYGEDWKKVAEHVGRSEKDCVARFIKLPFGEQFLGPLEFKDSDKPEVDAEPTVCNAAEPNLSKRRRLTPLADASNPIMAQAAFFAAMVGSDVVKAASEAALEALCEIEPSKDGGRVGSKNKEFGEADTSETDDQAYEAHKEAAAKAESQLDKEQQDIEQSISGIVEAQMKEIQEKLVHFEELEMLVEKEWQQVKYIKDLLFADQLTIQQQMPRLTRPRKL